MSDEIKALIVMALTGVAICFSFYAWNFSKQVSYTFSYESKVEQTVCRMVKPEYLKEPC